MAGQGESMTSERRLAATERQRKALELRKAGVGYQKIANELGYKSLASAYDAVHSALKKTLQEPADEVRRLELERLDTMLIGLWAKAARGSEITVDRVLKIMDRRARLLGLDAPVKFDIGRVVAEIAAELGMTPDETTETVADITAMLTGRVATS